MRLLRRGPIRNPPAGPADIALRLLLRHSDWLEALPSDDVQMLHELDTPYGEVVRWLESQLMEHGPMTWSALHEAMAEEPWAHHARSWVRAGIDDDSYGVDALRRAVRMLWQAVLRQEADSITAGSPTADDLSRYREILAQITAFKASPN